VSGPRLIPLLETVFAVIVWGASFIATKIALRELSPAAIVWLRFAMGVAILGAAVAVRKQFSLPARREWGYFLLLGFLGIAFHQWLQSNALQTSEAATTAWIVASTPVFMAILGRIVLREQLAWPKIAGIAVAAIGVLMVVSHGDLLAISVGRFGVPGDVLVLISSINWAVFSIAARRGLQNYPAAWMMLWVMLAGWLITSLLFFTTGGLHEFFGLSSSGWLAMSFLGVFCSGLAYIAWFDALKSLSAVQTGVFLYIEPLVAVVVAAVLLAERITPGSLLGGAIILAGVYLVNKF
jgi:drug/metabolite transporter (DMT)-like permease